MISTAPSPGVNHALRLVILWIGWLLVMLFQLNLGLMPLFHGLAPQNAAQLDPVRLSLQFGAVLLYFVLPLLAMLLIAFVASDPLLAPTRPLRAVHFGLGSLYTITNIPQLIADIGQPEARADQIVPMAMLVLIALLINRESWLWWQERRPLR